MDTFILLLAARGGEYDDVFGASPDCTSMVEKCFDEESKLLVWHYIFLLWKKMQKLEQINIAIVLSSLFLNQCSLYF